MDHDERKRRLRRRARLERAARPGPVPEVHASLLELPELATARTVAGYTAYGVEPSIDPLLRELLDRGVRVLLPVLRLDHDLDWIELGTGDRLPTRVLRSGSTELTGVAVSPEVVAEADVVIVPALLVGADGARLGQGGGSYDRALRRVGPGTPVVAVVHDAEFRPAGTIPRDTHDRLVTHLATPTGLRRLNA